MSIQGSSFNQASINSWMLSHSNDINQECQQSIKSGYANVEEQEALKDIQNTLAGTGVKGGYGVAQAKIEAFLTKYGQNEEIARIAPQLKDIANRCAWDEAHYNDKNIDIDSINSIASGHATDVQNMCDRLVNDQKYGDIERQDLSSQRDQVFQAASSLTSSQNQSISTILTTLRG
jgi:hypothetical protein